MINLDSITNENIEEHKKTNALLNLLKEQNDIDKTYSYAKDLSEPKSEFLIKKRENVVIKPLK